MLIAYEHFDLCKRFVAESGFPVVHLVWGIYLNGKKSTLDECKELFGKDVERTLWGVDGLPPLYGTDFMIRIMLRLDKHNDRLVSRMKFLRDCVKIHSIPGCEWMLMHWAKTIVFSSITFARDHEITNIYFELCLACDNWDHELSKRLRDEVISPTENYLKSLHGENQPSKRDSSPERSPKKMT